MTYPWLHYGPSHGPPAPYSSGWITSESALTSVHNPVAARGIRSDFGHGDADGIHRHSRRKCLSPVGPSVSIMPSASLALGTDGVVVASPLQKTGCPGSKTGIPSKPALLGFARLHGAARDWPLRSPLSFSFAFRFGHVWPVRSRFGSVRLRSVLSCSAE